MKLLIIILASILLIGCATTGQVPVTKCVQEARLVNVDDLGRVWCCCNTTNGVCCNYTTFCPGYIPGCFCW